MQQPPIIEGVVEISSETDGGNAEDNTSAQSIATSVSSFAAPILQSSSSIAKPSLGRITPIYTSSAHETVIRSPVRFVTFQAIAQHQQQLNSMRSGGSSGILTGASPMRPGPGTAGSIAGRQTPTQSPRPAILRKRPTPQKQQNQQFSAAGVSRKLKLEELQMPPAPISPEFHATYSAKIGGGIGQMDEINFGKSGGGIGPMDETNSNSSSSTVSANSEHQEMAPKAKQTKNQTKNPRPRKQQLGALKSNSASIVSSLECVEKFEDFDEKFDSDFGEDFGEMDEMGLNPAPAPHSKISSAHLIIKPKPIKAPIVIHQKNSDWSSKFDENGSESSSTAAKNGHDYQFQNDFQSQQQSKAIYRFRPRLKPYDFRHFRAKQGHFLKESEIKQKKEEKIRTAADFASQRNAKLKADGRKLLFLQSKLESMAKNEDSDAEKFEIFIRNFICDELPKEKLENFETLKSFETLDLKDEWQRCAQRFKTLTGEFRRAAAICGSILEGHQPKILELIEKFSSRRPLRNS